MVNEQTINIFVDRFNYKKGTYCLVFELAIDYYLYPSFGFLEQSENTRGDKLNFKENNDSVLELIDEMDIQSQYIGAVIFKKALKPLLQYELN